MPKLACGFALSNRSELNRLSLRVPTFAVDPSEHVVEHPMKQTKMQTLDHPHVVEGNVQAVLLHLLDKGVDQQPTNAVGGKGPASATAGGGKKGGPVF